MPRTQLPTHVFQPDGIPDHRGVQGCTACPLPAAHPCHHVPPVPADAAHVDARRIGEASER